MVDALRGGVDRDLLPRGQRGFIVCGNRASEMGLWQPCDMASMLGDEK